MIVRATELALVDRLVWLGVVALIFGAGYGLFRGGRRLRDRQALIWLLGGNFLMGFGVVICVTAVFVFAGLPIAILDE